MKALYLGLIILILTSLNACAPGHHLAFEQFNVQHSGTILSVQGYVIQDDDHIKTLKKNWTMLAKKMRQKPGFISCHLSPGIGQSMLWLAHSKWESIASLRNAFADPTVLALEEKLDNKFEHLFSLGESGVFHSVAQTGNEESHKIVTAPIQDSKPCSTSKEARYKFDPESAGCN